jgi:hypothetical protein
MTRTWIGADAVVASVNKYRQASLAIASLEVDTYAIICVSGLSGNSGGIL